MSYSAYHLFFFLQSVSFNLLVQQKSPGLGMAFQLGFIFQVRSLWKR